MLKSRATSQRDLDRLEGWTDTKLQNSAGTNESLALRKENPPAAVQAGDQLAGQLGTLAE